MGLNKQVTFSTAKLLKEKGWYKPTLHFFFEDGDFKQNELTGTNGYYGDEYCFTYEEFLENWNDGWVTKKNGDRCFGCQNKPSYFKTYSAPTIAEVVMWLYEKHGVWIYTRPFSSGYFHGYIVDNSGEMKEAINTINFNSPTEAYEAAILYTLKNLIP